MKGARWFVVALVVVLFSLSVLGLVYKTSTSLSIPLSYQQTEIGFITLYSPAAIYDGHTSKAFFYLQSWGTLGKDCQANVEVNADPAALTMQTTGTQPVDQLSFSLDNQSNYWQTIRITPAASIQDPIETVLKITYTLTCDQATLLVDAGEATLSLDPGTSHFKRFLAIAADSISQPGLFTSLSSLVISIVALWVTTSLEDERRRNERWARINAIEKEMETDFVHAVGQLAVAEKESRKRLSKWDRDQRDWLQRLRQRGEDRAGVIALLLQINRALERDNNDRMTTILSSVKSFYRGDILKSLQAFADFRGGQITEENLEAIFKLWDEYDAYSKNIIIETLLKLQKETSTISTEKIKGLLEHNDRRRRIIRHKPLIDFQKKYKLTIPGIYTWDWPGYIPPTDPEIQQWFKTVPHRVLFNTPFSPDLVENTWEPPVGWDQARQLSDSHVFVRNPNDMYILARQMWHELREIEKYSPTGVFPLYWEVFHTEQTTNMLGDILHHFAEAWLEFISLNPGAYLDLGTEERHSLAACLGWHAGSIQTAEVRIRHKTSLLDTGSESRKREIEVLLEFLVDQKDLYGKDVPPAADQMLDWLQIRPPWLLHTVLMLIYSETPPEMWGPAINQLRNSCHKCGLVIKEFETVQRRAVPGDNFIEWKDDKLQSMLSARISRTTRPARNNLDGLFRMGAFPKSFSADKELIRLSQRSLSRMLELGDSILLHHARSANPGAELQAEDFPTK